MKRLDQRDGLKAVNERTNVFLNFRIVFSLVFLLKTRPGWAESFVRMVKRSTQLKSCTAAAGGRRRRRRRQRESRFPCLNPQFHGYLRIEQSVTHLDRFRDIFLARHAKPSEVVKSTGNRDRVRITRIVWFTVCVRSHARPCARYAHTYLRRFQEFPRYQNRAPASFY